MNLSFFRKPTSPPLTLRDLRKPTSPPLNLKFFLKSTRPSLPLKKAPPLSPSPFPLRVQGMYQPPYSVLKPLRYKVGGPSEVYASSGAAVFLCGINRRDMGGAADATAGTWGLLLMGTQGHNAGCGDNNTFYSTLDRIDSGEVHIRVMAEIL